MKFEILAPAGSQEALVAGVRCGANAVYLGGKSFNARRILMMRLWQLPLNTAMKEMLKCI